MRRIALTCLLIVLALVPATSASAESCAQLEGSAVFDFGTNNVGRANLIYDGAPTVVYFTSTGFVETGPGAANIFFDWYFPEGTLEVVEHSRSRPLDGSRVEFRASVDVIGGGHGGWFWYGQADLARGVAVIEHMTGEVCIG